MPQCLFCLREGEGDAVHFTDGHVFPAALGGNLVVKYGTCDKCNDSNSKFEQALAIELTPIRMLLQIPDRYGKVPHTAATRKYRGLFQCAMMTGARLGKNYLGLQWLFCIPQGIPSTVVTLQFHSNTDRG